MSCGNNTFNIGPCNAPSSVNIKKLFFQLNDCQTNSNFSNCNDVWTVDCLGNPGCSGGVSPCGVNGVATLHCAAYANIVSWITGQISNFLNDSLYPWNRQTTVTFNTSASTTPDSTSNSSISGFDPNGSYWLSDIGSTQSGAASCNGCLYPASLCPVLTGQMVAYQMTGTLYISEQAYVYDAGPNTTTPLEASAICQAIGGGCPPPYPCQSYDTGPLQTYYIPLPDFNSLCPDGMTFSGAPSGNVGMGLFLSNGALCCGNLDPECTFVPSGPYLSCGSNPP